MSARRWLVAALVVLAPAAAVAQPPSRPDTVARDSAARVLPTVEVTTSVLPVAGPAVGSGIPARFTVVPGERLRGRRLLPEALAAEAGVSLYDDLGSAYKPTMIVRGFTASPVVGLPQGLSVFLDGVPVNEPDAGQVNFDLLPLDHVRRVEVLSGTAALLGPNSLGGALNLVTRRGEGALSGEVAVGGGTAGRRSLEADVGGERGGVHYYAGAGWGDETGWRQLTAARLANVFVNVGREGARGGVNLQLHGAASRAETAGSLPGSVYAVRPDSNLSAGDFEDLRQLHAALSGHRALWRGHASASLWARWHDAERFNVNQVNDPDVRSFSENRTVGLAVDWRAARALGAGTLGVRLGGGAAANEAEVRIHAERIDPRLTTDVHSPIRELDAYAIADWRVGRVTLTGGLRQDVVRIPFRNRLNPARDTVSTFTRLNPSVGVNVQLGGGWSAYASGARGFRAPAVIELACADPEEPCPLPFALGDDPPLAPVVATSGEAGVRLARGPLVLGLSAYRTDLRDDIFLLPYEEEDEPEGSTIDGYFANVPGTRREGAEATASLAVGAHLLFANYGWTRATFRTSGLELFSIRETAGGENEVEVGDRLPLVPEHTLALGGELALPRSVRLGAVARYTGERWPRGDEANETEPLAGFWLADVRLGVEAAAWTLEATVTNVLDVDYARYGTFNFNQGAGGALERFLTPGEPRQLLVTLRRRWGG